MDNLLLSGNHILSVKDIGVLIRYLRKEMKITQEEAAGLCSVGVRFLSDIENGKPTLQIEKVIQVLHNFGVQINLTHKRSI